MNRQAERRREGGREGNEQQARKRRRRWRERRSIYTSRQTDRLITRVNRCRLISRLDEALGQRQKAPPNLSPYRQRRPPSVKCVQCIQFLPCALIEGNLECNNCRPERGQNRTNERTNEREQRMKTAAAAQSVSLSVRHSAPPPARSRPRPSPVSQCQCQSRSRTELRE